MAILHFKASYTKPALPTVSSKISTINLYDSPIWQLTHKNPTFTPHPPIPHTRATIKSHNPKIEELQSREKAKNLCYYFGSAKTYCKL
jgi:hypothetical protein